MNIFNSLGSNYNFGFVLKALFANNSESHKKNLVNFLENKYKGHIILVYKGREAIGLALELLSLPKDSFVAINGFTCVAVFNSIRKAGFEPVCLDLQDSGGLNFTANSLEKAVSKNNKIKVVVIQNTLGYPCDIDRIVALCKKHNLILIEDLAHCVGTRYLNGKEAGEVGDFVVLSFSQDKIIDAVSGGALIIRNKKYQPLASQGLALQSKQQLTDRPYPLLTFIIRKTYPIGIGKTIHFFLKSFNLLSKPMNEDFYDRFNLPNWYQYLTLTAFNRLNKNIEHRRKIAGIYVSSLPKDIFMFSLEKTKEAVSLSSNLRFPIFIDNRSELIRRLKNQGVYVSDIWYTDVAPESPNAIKDSKIILNLPTHINISEIDAKRICTIINLWLKSQ